MSLVPFLLNELLQDYRRPSVNDIIDQHFGMPISSDPFFCPSNYSLVHMPIRSGYLRPWRHVSARDSGVSSLVNDKNEFRVDLDVQQFKPEELKVTVDNGFIVVDGKSEERLDEHGYVSRQFSRRYKLPEDIDQASLASKLSSDGVLTLHAKKMIKNDGEEARELPITHTNEPIRVQDDKKADKKDDKPPNTMETN